MNSKQRKTLTAIFAKPIRRNISWPDVVNLIKGLGGDVLQGSGSRARFDLNSVALNIHSPHPGNELKRYQVQAVRDFLTKAGIKDEI
ncbi:type II toxin-antitoxin system HicA family toxin [Acaryochloris thomasi]|uniref:type II toxin-antitoxin system HicA family toxin n=1 Tax=Acaryochloris thomasi TaxID=2929456 RepID=UPI000DA6AD95|nr:type II toxin-antitoxin system HicA family toxin [Acaryochloris thomasi]